VRKVTSIIPQKVEFIPERLEQGILYVSPKYKTAIHLCCCGCGKEVVTPLSATDWSLKVTGNDVTLHPSIGNWSFECRSHYWIRNNRVVWAEDMSQAKIERGRAANLRRKAAYFEETNSKQHTPKRNTPSGESIISHIRATIKRWIGL